MLKMNLPGKRRDYFDNEVYELVSLIETSDFSPITKIEHLSAEDDSRTLLTDKLIGGFTTQEKINSKIVSIKTCEGVICREFKAANYQRYLKFVDNIHKSPEINQFVSKKFLLDLVFDYIIEAHKQKKTDGNFSDYLLDKIEASIKEYRVYFSIHNLGLLTSLTIGKVYLGWLEKDIVVDDNIRMNANSLERFNKKYRNKLFACFTVKAEKDKAIELAFDECSLAIDLLKICSDTIDDPMCKISFDIDSRVSETATSEIIVRNPSKVNDVNIIQHRIPNFHQITNDYKQRIMIRNFDFFNQFISNLLQEKSELQKILVNAIRRFGKALTTNNLNQRVVELFTIMESLVVPNAQSNIQESLTRYCSKIVYTNKDERLTYIKLIKKMYEVRSAYVHHAIEMDIETEDLRDLQQSVQALIGKLIEKSWKHQDKASVLKEIDDAILEAY